MVRRAQKGMTLIEVSIGLAIFGAFVLILVSLQSEMLRFERSIRLKTHDHPDLQSLVARVRRDVYDSVSYPLAFDTYSQSPTTLIVSQVEPDGTVETIVYDFSKAKFVTRSLFRGPVLAETWKAGGLPEFRVASFDMPEGMVGVRLTARNEKGETIVDRVFQPRVHP